MADRYELADGKVSILDESGNLKRTLTLEALGHENHMMYRELTGQCETCGYDMEGHTQCKSCGILIGLGHLETYGKGKCDWCLLHPRLKEGVRNG